MTYTWTKGSTTLGTGTQYVPVVGDVGSKLKCTVTDSIEPGSVFAETAEIEAAE